ncbi:MAG: 4-(cytidine 5'-diphospho)-2-C-methyl-D-erythritol kinase [Alphaproteobacteria bacterium]|nr:4-(cytidine 5'-diphospho)-2-C-methyl-D-erythritol kinase [Alphaproteobacteria bacterium]
MFLQTQCPAKLNLFLKINNLREDGFHELQSIFIKINLYDELKVEKHHQFELVINGEFSKNLNDNNIIHKIFTYFSQKFNLQSAVKVSLTKNIPVGSGLGGGSSDGAYFIKILNKIFNLNLSKTTMQKISAIFGSDLPFFFEEKICLVEGRGEIINPIENFKNHQSNFIIDNLNKYKNLLIFPRIQLSTNEVFTVFKNQINQSNQQYLPKKNSNYFLKNSFIDLIINNHNDLEKSAFYINQELQILKQNLEKFSPLCTKMTGSGSAFFAIFSDVQNYKKCLDFFYENHPNFFLKKDIKFVL